MSVSMYLCVFLYVVWNANVRTYKMRDDTD